MRHLSCLLLAASLALGASTGAGAANLTLQGGTLGISIGALPPISFACTSCPRILPVANPGNGNPFIEPAAVFTGSIMLPTALFTGVALIDGLTIANVANGEKVINVGAAGPRAVKVLRAGGDLGGKGPLEGTALVNVLGLFNLAVPLTVVGNTGAAVAVTQGTLMVAVNATGWTTGNATINQVTTANPTGNVPRNVNTVTYAATATTPNAAQLGYDNRTPNGNGVVQLISPFHVLTNAAGNLPGLALQTLTFASPEPGSILLLGAALGSVVLLARRRTRR